MTSKRTLGAKSHNRYRATRSPYIVTLAATGPCLFFEVD
jgi:hypothetical protein